jgi:LDH2 family malate/lactate/ureidoglycolate dehydrogenase
MFRLPYQDLFDALLRVLLKLGFEPGAARLCAQLFANTTRDGVYSHGLNRFPRFVSMIRNGYIDVHAVPALVTASGPLERWDGNLGPGNLNAWHCMERTITLAREHGMGCVALANTNHWMRGGSYGWQAADAGGENGQSQVFLAFDVALLDRTNSVSRIADQVIEYFQLPRNSRGERIRYPGYRVLITRRDNLANGIPVEPSVWQQLDAL